MENFTIEIDADGIALVTFDVPGRSMNAISASVQRDLDVLVAAIKSDDSIRAMVLQSGKESGFCAGADLTEMPADMARWRAAETEEEKRAGALDAGGFSQRIRAIETCGKPVAAVIAGLALGGGLELALGCHFRVAVDDPKLRLALPEASIGLMPGAGGTQRLSRLIGVNAAMPYLLDGKVISPAEALAGGIVHAVVPHELLIDTARRWILDRGTAVAPWDREGFKVPGGEPRGAAGYPTFGADAFVEAVRAAPQQSSTDNMLKALYEGSKVPMDPALLIESRYFFDTARSPEAMEKVEAFLNRRTQRES